MKTLSQNDFIDFISKNPKAVVKFSAPWCAPCRVLGPMLEGMTGDFPQVAFAEVNIDESPHLAAQFNVRGVPTMIGFSNAEINWVKVGLPSNGDLRKSLSDFSC